MLIALISIFVDLLINFFCDSLGRVCQVDSSRCKQLSGFKSLSRKHSHKVNYFSFRAQLSMMQTAGL